MNKKISLLISCLTLFVAMPTSASNTNNTEATKPSSSNEMNWHNIKNELQLMTERYKDSKLDQKQKVKFLPRTNELLSYMQDIKLSESEKQEQIKIVVKLLEASLPTDFASSNMDTLYFEYKKFQKAYENEINNLENKRVSKDLIDTFKSFEDREKSR